jgi:hypothetical protein
MGNMGELSLDEKIILKIILIMCEVVNWMESRGGLREKQETCLEMNGCKLLRRVLSARS